MNHSTELVAPDTHEGPAAVRRRVGGDLEGFTEETYASSSSILDTTRSGGHKGLQQYFTPPSVALFIQSIINAKGTLRVCDPTAGDGGLLWPHAHRYGVELHEPTVRHARSIAIGPDDPRYAAIAVERAAKQDSDLSTKPFRYGAPVAVDQSYTAIRGDLQHVYPLLRVSGTRFSAFATNPPFGLTWQVKSLNDGRPASSTLLAWLMCQNLKAPGAQGAFICGSSRLDREILESDGASAVYCVVDVVRMFPGVDLACSIAFWADADFRLDPKPHIRLTAESAHTLPAIASEVIGARQLRFRDLPTYDSTDQYKTVTTAEAFSLIQDAYNRRTETRLRQATYDVSITGDRIDIHLSPLAIATMDSQDALVSLRPFLTSLNRQRTHYFALNTRDWRRLQTVIDSDLITMSGSDREKIDAIVQQAKAVACPVYPIEPQQRLAYIQDLENLTCTKGDPERGYVAGDTYPVDVSTEIESKERTESKVDDGEVTTLTFRADYKVLRIMVGGESPRRYSETKEDIEYLLEHFDIPDPGDVSTRYPEEIQRWRTVIQTVHDQHMQLGFTPRPFQVEDVARLLFKGSAVLSWEQGGGKTFGSMLAVTSFEQAGQSNGSALFIVPQDLIPQWTEECSKFFGRKLIHITTRAQARAIARGIKSRRLPGEWYITHYEALAINNLQVEHTVELERILDGSFVRRARAVKSCRGKVALPEAPVIRHISTYETEKGETKQCWQTTATSKDICPRCYCSEGTGLWDGYHCRSCGETRARLVLKPMAHELAVAFKHGCIVVDEGTKIKADDSLTSLAVRGLRARHRILLTGTPQKNYVHDLFHLLCWALGPASIRFPFAYGNEGKRKFEADFCVVERLFGGKRRKVLPEVTNLSVLWRLLSGAIIRRRKENMGETIVERTFMPVTVPFGTRQREQYVKWLNGFSMWYHEQHPDIDFEDIERQAAILGQLVKLEYATTLPSADPDADYWHVGVSNWTPKLLNVLEICKQHVEAGEQVLVGSDLMHTGRFIAQQLGAKGISAGHILDDTGQTLSSRLRAARIREFTKGETTVLCASLQSIAFGHNMDCASVVVLAGLPWDFATLDQFLARVHRLTSRKPVTVYVVLTEGSLDERKWKLLQDKTASAELAIDGHLVEKKQKPISQQQVLDELKRKGLPIADTIAESDIRVTWQHAHPLPTHTPITASEPDAEPISKPVFFQFPVSASSAAIRQLTLFGLEEATCS